MGLRFRPIVELRSGRVHAIAVIADATGPDDRRRSTDALATLAGWRLSRPAARDAAIAIDLAASDLARLTRRDLAGALAHHGLGPEALIVRVERFGLGDPTAGLDALVDAGITIAIGDLDLRGADAGLLAGAPIDVVELPAGAIARVDAGPPPAELRQLLALAHRHDWLTLATGVTRDAQVVALDRLGCDLQAGPLLGGDLDEAAVDRWLAAR